MREIKFRAWDKEEKKMFKVVSLSDSNYGDCEVPYIKVCELDKSPIDKLEIEVIGNIYEDKHLLEG